MAQGPTEEQSDGTAEAREPDGPLFDMVLTVTGDDMRVLLDYHEVPSDLKPILKDIREKLTVRGIPSEHLGEALERRLREAAEHGGSFKHVVLIEGTPASPTEDGFIKWGADYFSPGFVVDEDTGVIDYRKRVAQTSVEAGDRLAMVVPPKPGQNGRDVFGKIVPASKGVWPLVRLGSNVREERNDESQEVSYYATTSGRIRWAAGTLSVDDVYTVEGNVGLATGHIDHPGAVVVEGDIEADSSVKARGDLEVRGIIEQADVRTGGNLIVHGGIIGRGKEKIVVAGRVHARFINDVELEAGRDVVVEREIRQSTIRSRGTVAMQYGRLVGGETTALGGILVGQTGSEALVPTVLIAGRDYRLQAKIESRTQQIGELEERLEKIRRTVAPISARQARVSEETRAAIEALLQEAKEINTRIDSIRSHIDQLKGQSKALARPRIEISTMVHPETVLMIEPDRLRVKDELIGPVHATVREGQIKLRHGQLTWKLGEQEEEPSGEGTEGAGGSSSS